MTTSWIHVLKNGTKSRVLTTGLKFPKHWEEHLNILLWGWRTGPKRWANYGVLLTLLRKISKQSSCGLESQLLSNSQSEGRRWISLSSAFKIRLNQRLCLKYILRNSSEESIWQNHHSLNSGYNGSDWNFCNNVVPHHTTTLLCPHGFWVVSASFPIL